MGLKSGVIGNTLGEQLGNMLGTHQQLMKNKSLPPSPKTQIKKLGP
jgi:hypothetical protein